MTDRGKHTLPLARCSEQEARHSALACFAIAKWFKGNRVSPGGLREVVTANIRRLAGEKDIGLNALADLSGVGRTQLYDVLAGRKVATTDWLAKV